VPVKHIIPLFLLIFIPAHAQKNTPIAVSRLASSNISEGDAFALTNTLRTELGKTGIVDVMERTQMETILKKQGFQQTGACDETNCALEMGKLLSVKYMVLGSVGKVGKTYTVNARLVDVGTGKIQKDVTEYHKGSPDELLTSIMPVVAQKLAGTYRKSYKNLIVTGSVTAGIIAVAVPVLYFASQRNHDHQSETPSETDVEFIWK
jgi:TolB-like protein